VPYGRLWRPSGQFKPSLKTRPPSTKNSLFGRCSPTLEQEAGIVRKTVLQSAIESDCIARQAHERLFQQTCPTLMTHVVGVKAGSLRVLGAHSTPLTGSLIANSLGRDRKLSFSIAPATVSLLRCPLWVPSRALPKAARPGERRPLGRRGLKPRSVLSVLQTCTRTGCLTAAEPVLHANSGPCSLDNLWSLASFR